MNFSFSFLAVGLMTFSAWGGSVCEVQNFDLSKVGQTYAAARKNVLVSGSPLVVAGEKFDKGIGTHARSVIKLGLKEKATRFSARVGVAAPEKVEGEKDITTIPLADGQRIFYRGTGDDKCFLGIEGKQGMINQGSVVFRVLCDGKEVFNSGKMTPADKARPIDVELPKGAGMLELIVEDGGDGPSGDSAAWLNPIIGYEG